MHLLPRFVTVGFAGRCWGVRTGGPQLFPGTGRNNQGTENTLKNSIFTLFTLFFVKCIEIKLSLKTDFELEAIVAPCLFTYGELVFANCSHYFEP